MWPYYQTNQNMFAPSAPQMVQPMAQQQVVRVNGRGGAEAFAIGPNSSALLLDEGGRIVWVVTTDGAGYKTVQPYDIAPHKDAAPPDYAALESRLSRLEAIIHDTGNPSAARSQSGTDGSNGTN